MQTSKAAKPCDRVNFDCALDCEVVGAALAGIVAEVGFSGGIDTPINDNGEIFDVDDSRRFVVDAVFR